jgi:hypothetical protein
MKLEGRLQEFSAAAHVLYSFRKSIEDISLTKKNQDSQRHPGS